jgi:hypothetical protein
VAGRGVNHPPASSDQVKERVELYLYTPVGPSWPVLGRNLTFLLPPGSAGFVFHIHNVETCRGTHIVSCCVGTGVPSPGVKRPGLEDKHSSPSPSEVKE